MSVVTGFLAVCAAEAVAWSVGPAVPDLKSVAPLVFAGQSVQQSRDSYIIVPGGGWRGYFTGVDDEDRYGGQTIAPQSLPAGTDPARWLDTARAGLQADGWRYRGDTSDPTYEHSIWLTRDDYTLEVGSWDEAVDGEPVSADAVVGRAMPWWMVTTTALAGLLGAFAGWLLSGWVSRRTERYGPALRTVVTTLTAVVLFLMVPHALFGLHLATSNALLLDVPSAPPWVALFSMYFTGDMFVAAVILTCVILVLALLGPSRERGSSAVIS
ncbi:hypothetical protein [Actinoplanes sp. TFC3]|uniref:hypothetical protein n=1 Tax=Actinoplanes sp. TFC3 TaxID=1710355 RepID=UPI00129047CF|nr:hypothetical protein [Actinoplanes sp. TFC3]